MFMYQTGWAEQLENPWSCNEAYMALILDSEMWRGANSRARNDGAGRGIDTNTRGRLLYIEGVA